MMSEIVLVISNIPGVEGLNRARRAGVLALVIYFYNVNVVYLIIMLFVYLGNRSYKVYIS